AATLWSDWLAAERGRFALWLPVFMGAGDLAYFAPRSEPPGWAGMALFLPCLAAALLCRPWPMLRGAFAAAAAASLGFAAAQLATARALPLAPLPTRAAIISGTVTAVESLPEGRRIMIGAPKTVRGFGRAGPP